GIGLVLNFKGRPFAYWAGHKGTAGGLTVAPGVDPQDRTLNSAAVRIANGERYAAVVKVRSDCVTVYVNDVLIDRLKTDSSTLNFWHGWGVGQGYLGLTLYRGTIIYSAEVAPVHGKPER